MDLLDFKLWVGELRKQYMKDKLKGSVEKGW